VLIVENFKTRVMRCCGHCAAIRDEASTTAAAKKEKPPLRANRAIRKISV